MSKKCKTEPKADTAEEAKPEAKPEIQEAVEPPKPENVQRYSVEMFKKYSNELLGIDKCTFIGVSHELDGEYTVDEMKEIVKKWKSTKVKNNETEV